ncbi:unnamed protein product, partial [marine sediment metagenome]
DHTGCKRESDAQEAHVISVSHEPGVKAVSGRDDGKRRQTEHANSHDGEQDTIAEATNFPSVEQIDDQLGGEGPSRLVERKKYLVE